MMEPNHSQDQANTETSDKGDKGDKTDDAGRYRYGSFTRSQYRSRQHETAHEESADAPSIDSKHPLIPRGDAEFINTQAGLREMIDHLRAAGTFAYDSEFIGELTYIPKLCLIQVASAQRVALIDPLVKLDLSPFWQLLCDASVEKIVHAGQQDVEPVHRNAGCPAANVFDTQIAAGFVGLAYPVALSKLVNEVVGAKIGKGLTFTHWDQRPLSAMQLRYAADDVRYLPAVRNEIGQRLANTERAEWAKTESEALCDPTQYGFDPLTQYQRVRGATSLQPRNLAVLRELTIWRDAAARSHNLPARSLVKDEVLVDLARSPVKSVEKLDRVKGLPRPVEQDYGGAIVAATLRGLSTPAENMPRQDIYEPTPAERFRAESLFAAVQCLCAGQGIDPMLITSRNEVGEIYRAITEGKPLPEARLLTGWRRDAVGNAALGLLSRQLKIELGWDGALTATVAQ